MKTLDDDELVSAARVIVATPLEVGDERTRDRHALLLSARQLRRPVVTAIFEADELERVFRVLLALFRRERREQQRQLDVLLRREHRDQIEALEHEADVARAPVRQLAAFHLLEVLARDRELAAVRAIEPADQVEQRRLARARRPQQRQQFPGPHVEVHVVQRREDAEALTAAGIAVVGR